MRRLLSLSMVLLGLSALAQNQQEDITTPTTPEKECATDQPTNAQHKDRSILLKELQKKNFKRPTGTYSIKLVPVTYHIIQDDDGSNGISVSQVETAMERVNGLYKNAGIEFFQCGAIQYHKSTALNEYNKGTDNAAIAGFHVANTVNIYFANTVKSGSSSICGFANFPSNNHFTVIKNSCTYNGTSFEHELGHYYNLYHTHQTFGGVDEIVARPGEGKPTNCSSQGDGFCDTHADPSLSGVSLDANCTPDPNDLGNGPNGDQYRTEGTNIMSYASPKSCRSIFTDEQYAMMNTTVQNNQYRNNYTCPDAPVANFYSDKKSDCIQSTVKYYDMSTGTGNATYLWTFEGGTPSSSTDENPTVTYNVAGKHDVTLKITTPNGTNTVTKTDYVNITYPINLPYSEDFSAGTSVPNEIATETGAASSASVSSTAGKTDNGLALVGAGGVYYTYSTHDNVWSANPHYTSVMKLSCINATKYSDLSMTFDYKPLFESNEAHTTVRVYVNGVQVGADIYPADANGETWKVYNLNLNSYVGSYIDIKIEANGKTSNNGIYIDNINIDGTLTLSNNEDAGLLSIEEPSSGADYCSASITPKFNVKNFSNNTLNTVDIVYSVDGVVYPTLNETGLNLASNSTTIVTAPALGALGFGNHTLKAYVSNPNGASDDYALNDTSIVTFTVGGGVLGTENFDSQGTCGTGSDCEATECSITGNWFNVSNTSDDIDWRVDKDGTGSSNTGPDDDHTLGVNGGGNYIYTEASACYSKTAELKSKCIDLSKYESASLSFWYHMSGAAMGNLYVDVISGGTPNLAVSSLLGDQGTTWQQHTLDLTPYLGNSVQLVLRGVTGTAYTSDIAIDDIEVTGTIKIDTTVAIVGSSTICAGHYSTLVAISNQDYTYQWYKNNVAIGGATGSTYQVTESGDYTVKVTYSGSDKTSNPRTFTVDPCTSVEQIDLNKIQLYPNPSNSIVNIIVPNGSNVSRTMVLNNMGQIVLDVANAQAINISNLAKGLYNVQMIIDGQSYNKTIVKK